MTSPPPPPTRATTDSGAAVASYYADSEAVYAWWSPARHLHHGYWRRGVPLRHDPMLTAMVDRVVAGLALPARPRVADLGCGYGSSARHIAQTVPDATVHGYTIVPAQARWARAHPTEGVEVSLRDYRATRAPDGHFHGAFCLESLCYATGPDKGDLLAEAARILAPRGRLVLAGGFVVGRPGPVSRYLLEQVAAGWAVDTFAHLDAVTAQLNRLGFDRIEVEDAGWRIAPTVVSGHRRMATQIAARWWRRQRWSAAERGHLRAGMHGLWLGLCRHTFRYLIVSARRASATDRPYD